MCSASTDHSLTIGVLNDGRMVELSAQQQVTVGEPTFRTQAPGGAVIRSKYRGLSWDKKHQGWRVRIYFSGKQRHVGRFEDDVAAAKAYDKAAVYLYGSNAITNFGLEACHTDQTEVSTFIALAKEQAEQEQLARSHHRQHYSAMQQQLGMNPGFNSGYVLPQQTYLNQQQQHANMAFTVPSGMAQPQPSMSVQQAAWPNAAAPGAYALGQPPMTVMAQQQGSPQHQQQQMWAPVMQHQQQANLQPVGAMACAYLDPSTAAGQYPAGGFVVTPAQGMQGVLTSAGSGFGSPAASTAMLLSAQQQQPLMQQQQYLLQGAVPTSMPAQQAAMAAAGYSASLSPQVAVSVAAAVSTSPVAAPMAMTGPHELSLLAAGSAQNPCGEGSSNACGIAGSSFVAEMLNSLNTVASAGQQAAPLALQHQQQARMMMSPQSIGWMSVEGHQAAASWAMVQTPIGSGQGFPVATGMTDTSPSYSATSSTSANTSTGFALPRLCAVTSGTCS